ncbi:MAG TPA: TrkA family potassium uptake protein [Anaerolineaceae bacterium]|jgi:trk system potassium uptake protein TrkA|nr:TrkA family potassium uptake protein [Anaerolineaceae bacterium]
MKVIVIGCGRLGINIAREMDQRGNEVVVIDKDALTFENLGKTFRGSTVVGIGFDRDILAKAGVDLADALVAVTSSDEANVVTARIAKFVFRVPKVVARVYDPRKAEIYRRLGIPTISPVTMAGERISEMLSFSQLKTVMTIGSGEVLITEVEMTAPFQGKKMAQLEIPNVAHPISLTRDGKTMMAMPNQQLEMGDVVHLAVVASMTDRIREMLK